MLLNPKCVYICPFEKILGCRDPRCKHEYLDRSKDWKMMKGIRFEERCESDDESDKHI